MEDPQQFLMKIQLKLREEHYLALPGSPWSPYGEKRKKERNEGRGRGGGMRRRQRRAPPRTLGNF